jgi:hypothetical protein
MTTLELKLSLPDRLAEEAQAAGLLTPEAIESMLRETLRRQHVEELRQAMATLAAADIPPMSIEEIEAEVKAYGCGSFRTTRGRVRRPFGSLRLPSVSGSCGPALAPCGTPSRPRYRRWNGATGASVSPRHCAVSSAPR